MLEILVIEDSAGDLRLMKEALRDVSCPIHLNVVKDGEQALDYLQQKGHFSDKMKPSLILLDLNLPRVAGEEVLREIKSDGSLRNIPVIIFSSSRAPAHIRQAYELGANGYVCKPQDLDEFLSAVQGIINFWCSLASLPGQGLERVITNPVRHSKPLSRHSLASDSTIT